MNESEFKALIAELQGIKDNEYALGYRRGINRLYHGSVYSTLEEHNKYLSLTDSRGLGYKHGFTGKHPQAIA